MFSLLLLACSAQPPQPLPSHSHSGSPALLPYARSPGGSLRALAWRFAISASSVMPSAYPQHHSYCQPNGAVQTQCGISQISSQEPAVREDMCHPKAGEHPCALKWLTRAQSKSQCRAPAVCMQGAECAICCNAHAMHMRCTHNAHACTGRHSPSHSMPGSLSHVSGAAPLSIRKAAHKRP